MEMTGLVAIEITIPLPAEAVVDSAFRIEGIAKAWEIGAPPWVYAQVQKKDWYKPEIIEETTYERGLPIPLTGNFKMDWTPRKEGIYDVTIVATPAPLPLPIIGVPPITGQSDIMKVTAKKLGVEISGITILSYSKKEV